MLLLFFCNCNQICLAGSRAWALEDPLLLYGKHLLLLNLDEEETNYWRKETLTFALKEGPRWIWESRARLAGEIEYLKTF